MQFDVTGFLIFVAFILPGFLAQRARYSLAPRSLKPQSSVAEVGDFVLSGVWVHLFLVIACRLYFCFFAARYAALLNNFHFGNLQEFLWIHRGGLFLYFGFSLLFGYWLGFLQGWLIIKQPFRQWIVRERLPGRMLSRLGIPGFLQEDPVWYFTLKQKTSRTMVFLEVEMKNGAGIYTGRLRSYGIVDDSLRSKDFYLEDVYFKTDRYGSFAQMDCDGLLLNFEDVVCIQVRKGEPEDFHQEEAEPHP